MKMSKIKEALVEKEEAEKSNNTSVDIADNGGALTRSELENIARAAKEDTSLNRLLKFKEGLFYLDKNEVPLGTRYLAHTRAWVKAWIKFIDNKMVERKIYVVARGHDPADRNDLDELDKAGIQNDPWVLQYQVPLEDLTTGELVIFTTSTVGGHIGVANLCDAYSNRAMRHSCYGQPLIELSTTMMPTRHYGRVPRPEFRITGWNDVDPTPIAPKADMDDEIPF